MKDYLVSIDELDTLQCKLWDFCDSNSYYMRTYPATRTIEVWSSKELIANIRILNIDEPYKIIDDLKS